MYDTLRIRSDFPILATEMNGKPLVYLDSGATAQKPQVVIDALVDYYQRYNANVHRGVYALSLEATEATEVAREKVRAFINAPQAQEVIFTRGTTESINLVTNSWGRANLRPGDEVLITGMEHHSNIVPWQLICEQTGATLKYIPILDDGRLDFDAARDLIGEHTRMVAFAHMSNVLGTINPARQLIDLAHAAGAVTLIDGAQSVPHLPTDVQALDCDFLAFSGHKMCAPTGIGVLYGKASLLDAMPPWQGGGDMISSVKFDRSTWNELPYKFEAGTPNIADSIGLGVAVDYLSGIGMDAIRQHEIDLVQYAIQRVAEVEGVQLYGPAESDERGGVLSFTMGRIHPHDIGTILDKEGVAIRAGHHCAQPLMERFGIPATARATFYLYNTEADVDRLVDGLQVVRSYFTRVPRKTG